MLIPEIVSSTVVPRCAPDGDIAVMRGQEVWAAPGLAPATTRNAAVATALIVRSRIRLLRKCPAFRRSVIRAFRPTIPAKEIGG
jgi:hypothetical protein